MLKPFYRNLIRAHVYISLRLLSGGLEITNSSKNEESVVVKKVATTEDHNKTVICEAQQSASILKKSASLTMVVKCNALLIVFFIFSVFMRYPFFSL